MTLVGPGGGRIAHRGFEAVWEGRAVAASELVTDDATRQDLEAHLAAGRIEIDDGGRVRGIHGVTLNVTKHEIIRPGRRTYTWCALDAIGIPAALGIDAVAATSCPACGAALEVRIDGGTPRCDGARRLWLPDRPSAHLREEFCRHANLCCSAAHLDAARPAGAGRAATVAEAAALGREAWADVAGRLTAREPTSYQAGAISPSTKVGSGRGAIRGR